MLGTAKIVVRGRYAAAPSAVWQGLYHPTVPAPGEVRAELLERQEPPVRVLMYGGAPRLWRSAGQVVRRVGNLRRAMEGTPVRLQTHHASRLALRSYREWIEKQFLSS